MPQSDPCPSCGSKMHTADMAKRIYPNWRQWGATALLEDAIRVCPYCFAVELESGWERLKPTYDRAYQLATLSNNADKDKAYYEEQLGELPESESTEERDADAEW